MNNEIKEIIFYLRVIETYIRVMENYDRNNPEHLANAVYSMKEISEGFREIEKICRAVKEKSYEEDPNTFSDGYHTMGNLYEIRMILNACLFNEWSKNNNYDVHKSKKHSDGELCFGGGWFIVIAQTPHGQVSFHYKEEHWDLFDCEERIIPNVYDGHTNEEAELRLFKTAVRGENL